MNRTTRLLRGQDRRSVWHRGLLRKVLAALCLAAAVYAGVYAVRPPPPDLGPVVLVVADDVPVGTALTSASLRQVHVPAEVVPDGALTDEAQAVGQVTTAPLRAGEVLTDLRVAAAGPLQGLDPGLVLAHLPLATPELAAALRPGTEVDVLTTQDGDLVAAEVLVVQRVPGAEEDATASFLVAVTPQEASALAAAAGDLPGAGLTVVLRR